MRVAESGHRLAPIGPIPIGQTLFASNTFAILHKTRARVAADDFLVQQLQRPSLVVHRNQVVFVGRPAWGPAGRWPHFVSRVFRNGPSPRLSTLLVPLTH